MPPLPVPRERKARPGPHPGHADEQADEAPAPVGLRERHEQREQALCRPLHEVLHLAQQRPEGRDGRVGEGGDEPRWEAVRPQPRGHREEARGVPDVGVLQRARERCARDELLRRPRFTR
eukprot:8466724-Lingulodinium_polyedra.AAC.1